MLKSPLIRNQAIKIFALTLSFSTVMSSFTSVTAHPYRYRNNILDLDNSHLADHKGNSITISNYSPNSLHAQTIRLLDDFRNPRNYRRRYRRSDSFYRDLPAGTKIHTDYRSARKILLTRDEVAPIILDVKKHVRDQSGRVVIPSGSEIIGEIRPAARRDGSRLIAESVVLPNGDEYKLSARSRILNRTETYARNRRYNNNTWQNTAASVAAAAIIGGVVRDQGLNTQSILGDTIARVLLGGNNGRYSNDDQYYNGRYSNDRYNNDRYYDGRYSNDRYYNDRYYDNDLISIDTKRDLDYLTLTEDFYFDDFYYND